MGGRGGEAPIESSFNFCDCSGHTSWQEPRRLTLPFESVFIKLNELSGGLQIKQLLKTILHNELRSALCILMTDRSPPTSSRRNRRKLIRFRLLHRLALAWWWSAMAKSTSHITRSRSVPFWVRAGIVVLTGMGLSGCSTFRKQIAERRETCDAYCKRARAAKNEGYPDQADLLLNEAVRQRPDDLETRRHLAESLWECGRQRDALLEYRELAEKHPRDARIHQRLAMIYWTLGQADLAARHAESALRLDPHSVDALLVKARAEAAGEDFDTAVATYIRLTRAAPDLVSAKLELAEVHVQRGYSHQACAVLRDVISQPSLPAELKAETEWKLGLTFAAADRWSEAANYLGIAIERRNSTAADWQFLMTAKLLAGQDTSSLQAKAVTASAKLAGNAESTVWTRLRDRLAARAEILAHGGNPVPGQSPVVRAEFSRSAQATPER